MTVELRCHWDADGLCSGHFATFGIPDSELKIGVYEKGFGYTGGLTKDSWMLDMKPQDYKWDGTCIDHHLPHDERHKYKLISGEEPASLLTFNYFKDKIPKSEWWKVAIGLAGDGQVELIPTEVYKECPQLLKSVKTSAYKKYNWTISKFPLYKLLSSPINAFLRKGEYESAINLIRYADTPLALYSSEDARMAKMDVANDFKSAVLDCDIVFYDNLCVVLFYSKYRMSGYVGSALMGSLRNKTVMAINKRNGSLSLRGDLATYYRDTLKGIDYLEIDGHAAFMGGKLKKNYNQLLSDLDAIL